jgi:maspardin
MNGSNCGYDGDPRQAVVRLEAFRHRVPEHAIEVAESCWRYRRTDAPGVPLILLPGIQGTGDVFFELAIALGEEVDCVTTTAPPITDAEVMADSQALFMDAVGIDRADLFGSSLGGYFAQVFALRHADRVRQIFLANTFYDPAPFLAGMPPAAQFVDMPADTLMAQNMKTMLDPPATEPGQMALQAVMRAQVGSVQTASAYKSRFMALLRAHAIPRIPIAIGDVVLIDDDRDPMIPPGMRAAMRDRYAGAEHHMIAGGGHMPAIQRPRTVERILRVRNRRYTI